jgi:hypothetical protein
MALTQVPPALLTSTTGTGSTVVLSASPTFTGTVTTPSITFSDASSQTAAASPYVLKNRIINGAMVIDQRNAGAVATPTDASYVLDRWKNAVSAASKFTVQRNAGSVTTPAGFTNYLGITSTSAYSLVSNSYFHTSQAFEGFNMADLDFGKATAKTVTISFQVYSSLTGTFGGSIGNDTATRSYPFTYTISSANTWTTISITIPGDTGGTWVGATNAVWGYLVFGLGVGSTYSGPAGAWAAANYASATGAVSVVSTNGATFYITGVQLEQNTSATPFERRLYGQELMNCQRYYHKLVSSGGNATSMMSPGPAYTTVNSAQHYCAFPVAMRVNPTASVSSVNIYAPGINTPITAIATQNSSTTQGTLNFTVASGLTINSFYVPITSNGYIDFSAEL